MKKSIYNIGERVKVPGGEVGTIDDKLTSARDNTTLYSVDLGEDGSLLYGADELDTVQTEYRVVVEVAGNVVVGVLFEDAGGESVEIARGHGHIIHSGALGVAQAASYALRRVWDSLIPPDTKYENGGKILR